MYRTIKRLFDIFASLLALILISPVLLIVVIGIEVSDPGPLIYLANRVGKGNRVFRMYKFRSMKVEKNANERCLRPDQKRIFPFGRVMRNTKIDELPQLLNVLLGDMSVVGPRPASVDQVEITRGGENAIVSSVKTGLTSPAALYDYLYGDSIVDEDEYNDKVLPTRLALDRYYIEKQGILYDLRMIWYTALCILAKIFKKVPGFIMRELITSVNGDTRALNEVNMKA